MDLATIMDLLEYGLYAVLAGLLAYGGQLVLRGGGFRRDAPEDAVQPYLDVSHEL
jgi:hypothetical protein